MTCEKMKYLFIYLFIYFNLLKKTNICIKFELIEGF
jgi:hypothetical protein